MDFWWQQGWHGHKFKVGITNQLSGQPQKGFFKIVIRFARDLKKKRRKKEKTEKKKREKRKRRATEGHKEREREREREEEERVIKEAKKQGR